MVHNVCFLITVCLVMPYSSRQESPGLAETVESIIADKKNDPRTRPGTNTGSPLELFININVNSISKISESNMEFSVTMYLRQRWTDQRLAYAYKGFNRSISLGYRQFDRLWTPDVFIRNLKAGVLHDITVPNRLLRLEPDGTILYSQRLTVTLSCEMDLRKYPMDQQVCSIEFGSYGYTTEDIEVKWITDNPVEINPNINLPGFELVRTEHINCDIQFSTTGSFPCLRVRFLLERRLKVYLLSMFLPSLLVVVLSWVSFWIDLHAVPARISLSVITVLTITTQTATSNRGLPSVSSVKALDLWMAVCLLYVFGAFLEYAIVNTINRRNKRLPELGKSEAAQHGADSQKAEEQNNLGSGKAESTNGVQSWTSWWKALNRKKALRVDVISRVLFPSTFVLFNMIYWPLYLHVEFTDLNLIK